MAETQLLGRITADPAIFGGKPIVRGLRISVELMLSLLAQGESREAILDDHPELEPEDIRACIAYAVIAHDSLDAVRGRSRDRPRVLLWGGSLCHRVKRGGQPGEVVLVALLAVGVIGLIAAGVAAAS